MKPTQEPTYWELLKDLLDYVQSWRAADARSSHTTLHISRSQRELIRYFVNNRKIINKARLEHDLERLVWDLQADDRMWDWLTRRGGHFDYIRNDRIVETPREIYEAYCKRFNIPIPLPGQQQMQLF